MLTPVAHRPSHGILRKTKAHLKQGGLIAYATESCFGLGCDPNNAKALRRLLKLKQRHHQKGMLIVGASLAQLQPYIGVITNSEKTYLSQYWPGHYTLVLPASPFVLPELRGIGNPRIALRVTREASLIALCQALKTALVSTSANRSQKKSLKVANLCKKTFGKKVLTLPGIIGKHRLPSTIIDTMNGQILRQ